MTQPYPGYSPAGYPMPAAPRPKYRTLRRLALVSIVLMAGTALVTVVQTVLMWSSYDEVKRLVYGLLTEEEIDQGVQEIAGTGPLLNLLVYLFAATGITFLIWLWQARENTEVLKPPFAGAYPGGQATHRHSQGWTFGGWICPVVQFWYPLQVVADVVRAAEPPQQPGVARSGGVRGLLFGWWAAWCAFWVVAVGGGAVAVVSFVSWMIRVFEAADSARTSGDYVDIYDLQDYLVRTALAVNIGFTVASALLIVAAVTMSLLVLRVTGWLDARAPEVGAPLGPTLPGQSPSYLPPPQDGPPQYAPRPSYGPPSYGQPPYGGQQGFGNAGPGFGGSQGQGYSGPGPVGPGGYGGTSGTSPTRPPAPPTAPSAPRADHPTRPTPSPEAGPRNDPPGGSS